MNRERSEFLATVSHELRTPLTYIKGYADILERQTLTPDEQQRYITIIREESQQMNEWIEQLFWLARIDANAFMMERKPVDVEDLIHQVIRLMRPDIEQENVSFEIEGERLEVMGDAQQLRQMIVNIIENARRHTTSGKIIVRYGVNAVGGFHSNRRYRRRDRCRIFTSCNETALPNGSISFSKTWRNWNRTLHR